ncbi:homoserine kinase [Erythrobacter sp.]|uniref:homoserine kinase n=1 Tax=Erythrobacter sp. TaxID=1042 RepID=UPI001425DEAC|nr:homoserine kinase [Erythrobacter sp.]QIQ86857.1 MAG: homoserine kinase [Erythrobacter sp.]
MAVYTHLGAEELARLIGEYDVGALVSAKGIAEGVSNSNWLVETAGTGDGTRRFILTMYERRIELADLPYFLGLLDHLSARGCPVPRTIHDRSGAAFRMESGKALALIEYLPGVSPTRPSPAQAAAVGEALARMHLESGDFALTRANTMGFADNLAVLEACGTEALAAIDPALPAMIEPARAAAALDTSHLPRGNIHADLFPDNVLMLGERVTGMIDFYFACTDSLALDLATTHAAWCFDAQTNAYDPARGQALLDAYQHVRPLEEAERRAFGRIAQGAALRFVASRAEDWHATPGDALVTRKDPMEFAQRWRFYAENGDHLVA